MSTSELIILQQKLIESETKFKLLFERAPLAYQSLDSKGNIIEVNELWLTTLGYTKEEVIGRSLCNFLTPEWITHFKERFPKFKTIGEILGHEFELVKKSGEVILVAVQGRIGRDEVGEFKQTHCIFTDITKLRAAEKRTKRLEYELLKSQKREAIGRFAREIIHDLNNILTPMVFSVQMLELNITKEDSNYEWVERIKKAIDRASELISEINSFSKPLQQDTYQSITLQPIIEEVLDLVKSPSNIKLIKDIDLFDLVCCGLPIKFHQIVMNLITNAIHAIEPNDGIITVKFKLIDVKDNDVFIPTAPLGTYSCLTIMDNGCGMDEETISKLFDPFFTTRNEGLGLGMSVVDSLIKQLNGFICVNSKVGKGTKIRVYFPMIRTGMHI